MFFLEVELGGLHLDDGVLDVCETNAEEDVLGALGPHAPRVGQPAHKTGLKGQSHKIFYYRYFLQTASFGPIRDFLLEMMLKLKTDSPVNRLIQKF